MMCLYVPGFLVQIQLQGPGLDPHRPGVLISQVAEFTEKSDVSSILAWMQSITPEKLPATSVPSLQVAHILPGDAVYLPMASFFVEKALNANSINLKVPIQIFDSDSKQAFLEMHQKVPAKPAIAALKLLMDKTHLVGPDNLDGDELAEADFADIKLEKEDDDADANVTGISQTAAMTVPQATTAPPPPPDVLADLVSGKKSLWEYDKNEMPSLLEACKSYKFEAFVTHMLATYPDLDREALEQTWSSTDSENPEKDMKLYLDFLKKELQLKHDPTKKRPHGLCDPPDLPDAKAAKTCKVEMNAEEASVPTQCVQSDGNGNDAKTIPIAPSSTSSTGGIGVSDQVGQDQEANEKEKQPHDPQVACQTGPTEVTEESKHDQENQQPHAEEGEDNKEKRQQKDQTGLPPAENEKEGDGEDEKEKQQKDQTGLPPAEKEGEDDKEKQQKDQTGLPAAEKEGEDDKEKQQKDQTGLPPTQKECEDDKEKQQQKDQTGLPPAEKEGEDYEEEQPKDQTGLPPEKEAEKDQVAHPAEEDENDKEKNKNHHDTQMMEGLPDPQRLGFVRGLGLGLPKTRCPIQCLFEL